ncbi:glutamate--cysteine ligase [Nocardioides sp.]|uniref:carboxylate-amine ligase n=1 Tax=Nocardioides sp. TaxID=35761 RepID=UPI0031FEAC2D|nr:putative enzyme [Nocardioides sp.]
MVVRTVGIEEELLLVDPRTREVSGRSPEVLRLHRERQPPRPSQLGIDDLGQELFRHQLETRTDPVLDLSEGRSELVAARRVAGEAARDFDLVAVASATVPLGDNEPQVSPNDRYRDMVDTFGEIARSAGTCGMHVHVAIDSDEEGVAVIDRIAPWLPTLLAATTNSPYSHGRDTGHLSWRTQLWSLWPSAGRTEAFGSVAGYHEARAALLETGAASDDGMLYFDARLSVHQPTVEVRVFDVCDEPADAVVVAALVRALVEHAARDWSRGEPLPVWRVEALRAAHWRAARLGLTDTLLHPTARELRPAREVLESLLANVRAELEEAGDLELVGDGADRLLRATGATRQHAAFERHGTIEGVVDDLVERSERVWRD